MGNQNISNSQLLDTLMNRDVFDTTLQRVANVCGDVSGIYTMVYPTQTVLYSTAFALTMQLSKMVAACAVQMEHKLRDFKPPLSENEKAEAVKALTEDLILNLFKETIKTNIAELRQYIKS